MSAADDVVFAKKLFGSSLSGFGAAKGQPKARAKDGANRVDDTTPDESRATSKRPTLSRVEVRKQAERAAANASRNRPGNRPKKSATVGMRCTTRQKMILLALQEHLDIDTISDAAVEAILIVAAECEIKGAADELAAVQADRTGSGE